MKIRSGFVSNSSSSSFICNVCGETASGMDMSISEAEMFRCENGHTCCETHQLSVPQLSLGEKRQKLIDNINSVSYYSPEVKISRIAEIKEYDNDEVDESYNSLILGSRRSDKACPICMFQKIDEGLALKYLLKKHSVTVPELLNELKTKFQTFSDFKKEFFGE